MADALRPGVGLDPLLVDLLGHRVLGKRREGAAEGGFAGDFPGTVPAAELPQQGAGLERVQERPGGGELIGALGAERLRQPGARTGRRTVAAPFITAGEAAQIGQREDFAELLVQGRERSQLGCQRGEKLALQRVEDRRQVSHGSLTLQTLSCSNKPKEIPNHPGF